MSTSNQTTQNSEEHERFLPVGDEINGYIIKRLIGKGGFGITYECWDKTNRMRVVIKENMPEKMTKRGRNKAVIPLRGKEQDFEWARGSFQREVQTLSGLRHPNIVPVLTSFEANNTDYYVMPMIDGAQLDEALPIIGQRNESHLMPLLYSLLNTLDYLHNSGNLLHRDIKPANILQLPDGQVMLIDFGAARQLRTARRHTIIFTPGYAAPEQERGTELGNWTDLYGLAATFYHLITGTRPHANHNITLANDSQLQQRYSIKFLKGIDKALEPAPNKRWQTAAEWLAALPPLRSSVLHPKSLPPAVLPNGFSLNKLIIENTVSTHDVTATYQVSKDGKRLLLAECLPSQCTVRNQATHKVQHRPNYHNEWRDLLQDFRSGVQLAGSMQHKNIAPVECSFNALDTSYYTMPCADCRYLDSWPIPTGSKAEKTLSSLLLQLLDALTYLHKHSTIHGALSTHNILISPDGTPMLTDFSRAQAGSEKSRHLTPADDIIALGAVFYELITGTPATGPYKPLRTINSLRKNYSTTFLDSIDRALSDKNRWKSARAWLSALSGSSHEDASKKAAQEKLLKKGITPDRYAGCLTDAAGNGDSHLLSLLLAAGAKPDPDGNEWSALTKAAYEGKTACVKLLIAAGANVNRSDDKGWTPLLCAARYNHPACLKLLLAAPDIDCNKSKTGGWSPLMLAARHEHTTCVKALLSAPGINVNARNNEKRTALMQAARKGSKKCLKLLLNAPKADTTLTDKDGYNALEQAKLNNQKHTTKMLETLVPRNAPRKSHKGWALIAIIIALLAAAVFALIQFCDNTPSPEESRLILRNDYGLLPSQYDKAAVHAASTNQSHKLKLLLAAGANPNTRYEGWTPLMFAAKSGYTECTRALVNTRGIAVNTTNREGWTALMLAARHNHPDCVKLLLDTDNVDINKKLPSGHTALNLAINSSNNECAKLLLEEGAR